jgi:hypothetical protein
MAIQAIEEHGSVPLISPHQIPDDALVIPSAMMGAPTVMVEKLPQGTEALSAFRALENYLGRKAYATMSIEAGGLNSTTPISVAAALGIPLVDADGMGRAFPEIPMVTFTLYGISATPMAMADEKGNSVFLNTVDNTCTERLSRTVTVEMGGSAIIAIYPLSGRELKEAAVAGSITYAVKIGKAVKNAQKTKKNPIESLIKITGGFELFRGKIVDVQRRTIKGFARGEAKISGIDSYKNQNLLIHFQNENLIAIRDGKVMASVPDLITILDIETGQPITTESLKYGYRCSVLGMPCDEKWRTSKGLKLVGPRYFGYDIDYEPVEEGGYQ